MTLKIYGIPASRAVRTLWMARELGLPYESIAVSHKGDEATKAELQAINPNGQIPVIDDDGLVVWESMAINLYLARKHGGPLAPADLPEEAKTLQWSFWAATGCEKDAVTIVLHRRSLPAEQRDAKLAEAAAERMRKPLAILNEALKNKDHLVGQRFTVADLNVAAVMSWARAEPRLLDGFPEVKRWLEACLARPAFRQATGR